jgi:membrane protein DedA with SNARE-associated domain
MPPVDLETAGDDPDVPGLPASAPARRTGVGGPPSRRALTFVVAPLIALWLMARTGDVMAATLLPTADEPDRGNPYLLLVLSPSLRYQVGVVNYVDPILFFALAFVRLLVADPPFYLLGRWYGDRVLQWMERRSPTTGGVLRDAEGLYGKLVWPLVAVMPNNFVCALAGSSGMPPVAFFTLNMGGTLVRLWLIVQFGERFQDQIDVVLNFIGDNRWWFVGASAIVVGAMAFSQARSGSGEVAQLRRLGHELEGDASLDDGDDTDDIGDAGAVGDAEDVGEPR